MEFEKFASLVRTQLSRMLEDGGRARRNARAPEKRFVQAARGRVPQDVDFRIVKRRVRRRRRDHPDGHRYV